MQRFLLVLAALFACCGCLSPEKFGAERSADTKIIDGVSDVVTLPVKVAVGVPLGIVGCCVSGKTPTENVDAGSPERNYYAMLDGGFSCALTNADFTCASNVQAVTAMNQWLFDHRSCSVPAEEVRPFAKRVLQDPDLFVQLNHLWWQAALTTEDRRTAFDLARSVMSKDPNLSCIQIVYVTVGRSGISDDELRAMSEEDKLTSCGRLISIYEMELEKRRKVSQM